MVGRYYGTLRLANSASGVHVVPLAETPSPELVVDALEMPQDAHGFRGVPPPARYGPREGAGAAENKTVPADGATAVGQVRPVV